MNKAIDDVVEGEVVSTAYDSTMKQNRQVVKTSKLTDLPLKRRKFIKNYIETGNATQSAIKAGYSEHSAYSTGSRLLKSDKVLMVLNDSVELAEDTIKNLMLTSESEAIQLAAAKETLDRTIGKPIQRSETLHVNITVESMLNDPND